jgi:hypothetical protein
VLAQLLPSVAIHAGHAVRDAEVPRDERGLARRRGEPAGVGSPGDTVGEARGRLVERVDDGGEDALRRWAWKSLEGVDREAAEAGEEVVRTAPGLGGEQPRDLRVDVAVVIRCSVVAAPAEQLRGPRDARAACAERGIRGGAPERADRRRQRLAGAGRVPDPRKGLL